VGSFFVEIVRKNVRKGMLFVLGSFVVVSFALIVGPGVPLVLAAPLPPIVSVPPNIPAPLPPYKPRLLVGSDVHVGLSVTESSGLFWSLVAAPNSIFVKDVRSSPRQYGVVIITIRCDPHLVGSVPFSNSGIWAAGVRSMNLLDVGSGGEPDPQYMPVGSTCRVGFPNVRGGWLWYVPFTLR
jgi:hypothetical protein